jgi:uncharacterized membrane protein (DUF485 family)
MKVDLLIMFGAFIGGTLLALLFGADNTGIALAFGQIAFAIAVTYVIGRRP